MLSAITNPSAISSTAFSVDTARHDGQPYFVVHAPDTTSVSQLLKFTGMESLKQSLTAYQL